MLQGNVFVTISDFLQRVGFTLQASQAAVQYSGGPLFAKQACCPGGFSYRCVGRNAHIKQLINTYQQQSVDIGIALFKWLFEELASQCF